jgi:hypothetical protein
MKINPILDEKVLGGGGPERHQTDLPKKDEPLRRSFIKNKVISSKRESDNNIVK